MPFHFLTRRHPVYTIFSQVLDAFDTGKSHTTHKGMAWFNNLTEHCYSYYGYVSQLKMTGKPTFCMYCMHIEHLNMLPQDFHHFYYYMVDTHSNVSLQLNWDMIRYPTQHNFKQSLWSFKILFTQILLRQLVHKSHMTINTPNNSYLPLVTRYGYPFLQQGNLTHSGRGNGYKSGKSPVTMEIYNGKLT